MYVLADSGGERRGPHGERLGPDGRQLRACGAVRVSSKKQKGGHSPETQRAGILRAAREYGYLIDEADIFEDTRRGHVLKRPGYQAIIKGIEDGKYQACFVFMFDRIGRASVERVARAHDWDKRGVLLISAQEGVDEPGVLRMVRIGMAEEESRRIALRVVPNRLKGAQEGTHMGQTPYGYVRVYPESTGERRVAGLLVPHEPQAGIVRWLFASYAEGTWSTRMLADDLNTRGVPPPEPTDAEGNPRTWLSTTVHGILTNETYAASLTNSAVGTIVYGKEKSGYYLQTPGGVYSGEGKHVPLVDRETFQTVQRRLAQARYRSATPGRQHRTYLVSGLIRCQNCGGLMIPSTRPSKPGFHGQMWCQSRYHGQTRCGSSGYRLDVAEEALLAQVRRLRGAPWTPEHDQVLAGDMTGRVAQLSRALEEARETLRRHTRRMSQAVKEPSPAELRAFQEVSAELAGQVEALEKQLSAVQAKAGHLPRWRRLYAELTRTEVRCLVDRLRAAGQDVALRDLMEDLVASAVLVERWPERHSTWGRMEVTWTDDVQTLLDASLLTLDPPSARPELPPLVAERRARQRRYYATRRAREAARSAGRSAVLA